MQQQRFQGTKLNVALTMVLVTLMLAPDAWAVEYKALYKFRGLGDGRYAGASLVLDAAGNLYGTTAAGGANNAGTVFKLTPNPDGSWTESVLHSFAGPDGAQPLGGVTFDGAGNLYGTTWEGGAQDQGTVFKLTANPDGSWAEVVLHSFSGLDGSHPSADLIFDSASHLYGATAGGGANNAGTIFRLASTPGGDWTESVLYSFSGGSDGYLPRAGVILDAPGNIYGTTSAGGDYLYGVVFELTPSPDGTWTESVLHTFIGADGASPGGLVFDAAGNLYGTTVGGGAHGWGTVFELTPNPDGSWTESLLHSFLHVDGGSPGGLIFDAAGNLYGTANDGGRYDSGTVFKLMLKPSGRWQLTKLHVFKHGQHPGALLIGSAGNLYGTTSGGGLGFGVVFKITP